MTQPLSPGFDVWITAEPDQSHWSRVIDWYLGFQMMRASRHQPAPMPEGLKQILAIEAIEAPRLEITSAAPLMIASARNVPNSNTIMIPFHEIKAWVKDCRRIWIGLNRPKTRFFLPDGVASENFLAAWGDDREMIDVVAASSAGSSWS
jgi:hypothetical protein